MADPMSDAVAFPPARFAERRARFAAGARARRAALASR